MSPHPYNCLSYQNNSIQKCLVCFLTAESNISSGTHSAPRPPSSRPLGHHSPHREQQPYSPRGTHTAKEKEEEEEEEEEAEAEAEEEDDDEDEDKDVVTTS